MPRRDVQLTVALGAGPNTTPISGSWNQGIAVAADGHDDWGMLKGKVASTGDDIIGWTIKPQLEGDIATLRTMFDGTIDVELGPGYPAELTTWVGDPLWLMNDESGRLTKNGDLVPAAQQYCALALEAGKVEGNRCEVYVFTQKNILNR